jgi:derlin-1
MSFLIGNGGILELVGILSGHLYFFLMFKYQQEFRGPSLLATPDFLYSWFPNQTGGVRGFGVAPVQPQAPRPGGGVGTGARGYNWGQGRRLGD